MCRRGGTGSCAEWCFVALFALTGRREHGVALLALFQSDTAVLFDGSHCALTIIFSGRYSHSSHFLVRMGIITMTMATQVGMRLLPESLLGLSFLNAVQWPDKENT